jgi:hypothetical protein
MRLLWPPENRSLAHPRRAAEIVAWRICEEPLEMIAWQRKVVASGGVGVVQDNAYKLIAQIFDLKFTSNRCSGR